MGAEYAKTLDVGRSKEYQITERRPLRMEDRDQREEMVPEELAEVDRALITQGLF